MIIFLKMLFFFISETPYNGNNYTIGLVKIWLRHWATDFFYGSSGIQTNHKGEITGAVDIDNMYEFASSHCDDFKDLRDDDEIVINREWILNKLAEAENE